MFPGGEGTSFWMVCHYMQWCLNLNHHSCVWILSSTVRLNGEAIAVSEGDDVTCVIMIDNQMNCWGKGTSNRNARLSITGTADVGAGTDKVRGTPY